MGMAIHFILYAQHLTKFANWNECFMNDQDMIIYHYIGLQKILFNHQTRWHSHLPYWILSSKISLQKRSSCKKIKYIPICTHKKTCPLYIYRNFVPFGCSESIGWYCELQFVVNELIFGIPVVFNLSLRCMCVRLLQ